MAKRYKKSYFLLILQVIKSKIMKKRKLNVCLLLVFIVTTTLIYAKESNILRRHKSFIETEPIRVPSRNKTIYKPKNYECPSIKLNKVTIKKNYDYKLNQRKVLIVLSKENRQYKFINNLEKIFLYSRIKYKKVYKLVLDQVNIPSLVIFESYNDYLEKKDKKMFGLYFQSFHIGIIVFNKNEIDDTEFEFAECQLDNHEFLHNFLHMTKFNTQPLPIYTKIKYNQRFGSLFYNKNTSNSVLKCQTSFNYYSEEILFVDKINEIKHVFIGIEIIDDIWLLKSLFIDSIRYLTNGEIDISLKRYVQIDIDDIFVTKMVPEDVYDLIRLQNELSKNYFKNNMHRFKFVIGFSGGYFKKTKQSLNLDVVENTADQLIISRI